jgi:hypothetical protein
VSQLSDVARGACPKVGTALPDHRVEEVEVVGAYAVLRRHDSIIIASYGIVIHSAISRCLRRDVGGNRCRFCKEPYIYVVFDRVIPK